MKQIIKIYYIVSQNWKKIFEKHPLFDSAYDADYSRQNFLKNIEKNKGLKRKTCK